MVVQEKGERNYHIFYELVTGAPQPLLDRLHLQRNLRTYHYLNQSNVFDIESKPSVLRWCTPNRLASSRTGREG